MKKTPWFDVDVKPVRAGVYQTRLAPGFALWFCYWNGDAWSDSRVTKDGAANVKDSVGFQRKQWRGLTKEAK